MSSIERRLGVLESRVSGLEERVVGLEEQLAGLQGSTDVSVSDGVSLMKTYDEAIETYVAHQGAEMHAKRASAPSPEFGAVAAAASAGYTIQIQFRGGLTAQQKEAFKTAANRWTRAITGALPAVRLNNSNQVTTGVFITAQGSRIDGPDGILGMAGPTQLRPSNLGKASFLPAAGQMVFDVDDLAAMQANGTLVDVITHEMGHVLGFGTIWTHKNLLGGKGSSNPMFLGPKAKSEYVALGGTASSVPVENGGGQGTRDSHWRDSVFGAELMTGWVNPGKNPMSRLTVASMVDLGYDVNLGAADPYTLPSHLELGEMNCFAAASAADRGVMLTTIPVILSASDLA